MATTRSCARSPVASSITSCAITRTRSCATPNADARDSNWDRRGSWGSSASMTASSTTRKCSTSLTSWVSRFTQSPSPGTTSRAPPSTWVANHLDGVATHVDGGARDVVPGDGDWVNRETQLVSEVEHFRVVDEAVIEAEEPQDPRRSQLESLASALGVAQLRVRVMAHEVIEDATGERAHERVVAIVGVLISRAGHERTVVQRDHEIEEVDRPDREYVVGRDDERRARDRRRPLDPAGPPPRFRDRAARQCARARLARSGRQRWLRHVRAHARRSRLQSPRAPLHGHEAARHPMRMQGIPIGTGEDPGAPRLL